VLLIMSMKADALRAIGADDWDVTADNMLMCPCGYKVEDDGGCPEGCESPLKGAGIV